MQTKQTGQGGQIVLLGTGGTISGLASDPSDHLGYVAGQRSVQELCVSAPGWDRALDGHSLHVEQVAQLDSKDMDFATWQALALRCAHWLAQDQVRGLVITHGTDTLEETAYFLQAALAPNKPVVLTCAMRPASAVSADGPQNLLDAFTLAVDAQASGVMVVCAGVVHEALAVQKVHTYQLNAFGSGDAGPLAHVRQMRVRWVRPPGAKARTAPALPLNLIAQAHDLPRVEIVLSHACARAQTVRALLADGAQALVVAGTGNATVHHALEAALIQAQQHGVRVLRTTRCVAGDAQALPGAALPVAAGLSAVKARIGLALELLAQQAGVNWTAPAMPAP